MPHEIIVDRASLKRFLRADLEAHGFRKWQWRMRITRPQLQYQRLLRRVEYWMSQSGPIANLLYVITRIRMARLSHRLGLSIPPRVFGPGLSIPHYGTIVVNDKARIGAYCRIHTSTNIGEVDGIAPIAGDHLYIAPGAVLYGKTELGDRVTIGANSVVRGDFPSGCTIAGAPARIIKRSEARASDLE